VVFKHLLALANGDDYAKCLKNTKNFIYSAPAKKSMKNDSSDLATKLLKQGIAKTMLDAQRMAESMSSAKPFDPSVASQAEKYYDKRNPVNTNLNIRASSGGHIPTTQHFASTASASEVTALKEEIAEHKKAIQFVMSELEEIKKQLKMTTIEAKE
jgi:hypothetical protein